MEQEIIELIKAILPFLAIAGIGICTIGIIVFVSIQKLVARILSIAIFGLGFFIATSLLLIKGFIL